MSRNLMVLVLGSFALAVFVTAGHAAEDGSSSGEPAATKQQGVSRIVVARAASRRGGEAAIFKVLEQPVTIELAHAPLSQFVDHVAKNFDIPIVIDKKALNDAGIEIGWPISCELSGMSLRSALDEVLGSLELAWTIKGEVLRITTPEKAENSLITKCYDVSELIALTLDRAYRGKSLPTGVPDAPGVPASPYFISSADGAGATASLASASGAKTTEAGALYNIGPPPARTSPSASSPPEDMVSLTDLITSSVSATSWDVVGGPGTCAHIGGVLVITQTLAVHRQIEAVLADLRATRRASPGVIVELHWLWMDAAQRELLLGSRKANRDGRSALTVDGSTLEKIARTVHGFRGQTACASGQLVHLASGDRHSAITGAIPVVGSGIGYQPVVEVPNAGVVVELRPTVAADATTALLDLQSTVTRWAKPEPPAQVGAAWPPGQVTENPVLPPSRAAQTPGTSSGQPAPGSWMPSPVAQQETTQTPAGAASCPVDRPVMPAQQLAATVRVPLGKPVLVGAMTFAPTDDAGLARPSDNPKQLYLFATTSIAEEPAQAAPERKKRRR